MALGPETPLRRSRKSHKLGVPKGLPIGKDTGLIERGRVTDKDDTSLGGKFARAIRNCGESAQVEEDQHPGLELLFDPATR